MKTNAFALSVLAAFLLNTSITMARPEPPSKEVMPSHVRQAAQVIQPRHIPLNEDNRHTVEDIRNENAQLSTGHTPRPPAAHWGDQEMSDLMGLVRPAEHMQTGQILPREFRGRQYSIEDWGSYGLRSPAKGHRWVLIGADFIEINNTTGRISSIILMNDYIDE